MAFFSIIIYQFSNVSQIWKSQVSEVGEDFWKTPSLQLPSFPIRELHGNPSSHSIFRFSEIKDKVGPGSSHKWSDMGPLSMAENMAISPNLWLDPGPTNPMTGSHPFPFFVVTFLGFPSHKKLSVENFQQKPSRVPKPHAPSRSQ